MTYLRFTPAEYRSIRRACRSADFADHFFPGFQRFLVQALLPGSPELSQKISRLYRYQIGIIYEYLKGRRSAREELRLTPAEFQAVVQVCEPFVFHQRFLSSFRAFLVRRLQAAPKLAGEMGASAAPPNQGGLGGGGERRTGGAGHK